MRKLTIWSLVIIAGLLTLLILIAKADNTLVPTNVTLANTYPTSLVFNWPAPGNVNSYTIQASTANDFNIINESLNTQITTATLSDLTFNTVYYVRVNSTVAGSTSPWSPTVTAQTLNQPSPPLDRYGGFTSVYPDTTTGVYYKYWSEPDVNAFEYRAIVDDIIMLANVSTGVVSGCDQWLTINEILEKRVDPYMTYPPGVFRSTVPFDDTSLLYIDTTTAVAMNLISSNTINSQVVYSAIPICMEGKVFPW